MLRISVHDETASTAFTIEGKLTAPGATELEKVWQAAITARPSRPIVVSLVRVTFVDAAGKELLIRMRRQGVKLAPTGCLMKATVEQIEAEVAGESSHASS
jgi:anti-anti-sigma regulatory factor